MAKKRVQNKDEVIRELIAIFNDPNNQLSDREVAAKYNLDMALVRSAKRRSKYFKIQDSISNAQDKIQVIEDNHSSVDHAKEETVKEIKAVKPETKKSFPKKLDDSITIQIMCDIDDGMPKSKIAEKNGVSVSTVYRIEKQYCSKEPAKKKETKKNKAVVTKKYPPVTSKVEKDETVTDAVKLEIIKEINNGENVADISKKFNIKTEVVDDVCKEYGVTINTSEQETGILDKCELITDEFPDVICGLVENRHEIPVTEYIFREATGKGISEDLLYDYNKQLAIAEDFIKTHIAWDENGIPRNELVVYVTGLTSVLASVIKVARKMGVNLTLKHYSARLGMYVSQIIWDDFSVNRGHKNVMFKNWLRQQFTKVYRYNFNDDDFDTERTVFIVRKMNMDKSDDYLDRREIFIVDTYENAINLFAELLKSISNDSDQYKINISNAKIKDGYLYIDQKPLHTCYNHQK